MVVQLFKSNIYLSFVNIQSTYYVSSCYFNPNLPEVIDFKKSLLETQYQYPIIDEINTDIIPMRTIEEIVGTIVSLEVGKDDWSYTSCKTCPKKVTQSKDTYWCDNCWRVGFKVMLRYRLQVIVTDGSSCLKLLVWNKEVEQMVGKVVEKVKELFNINAVEGVYSITKLSDDESLTSSYGVANSSCDASYSQMLANIPIAETDENSNEHAAISLSRSNGVSSYQTPAKRTSLDVADDSTAEAALPPDVQASANKTFKRNCGRKKID
ncbi:hypothetical protein Ahy_B05g078819 [Arachis hypogaea]|uniref:Replication factor A C-terminal domain-containing protein n=1 Tax=Arachis hypogaea TaxID=3818 RepID=A0A444Z840_ARAHY|nr:hypothetical protein Ahy_B05g078819 [Arachis hypogaea]